MKIRKLLLLLVALLILSGCAGGNTDVVDIEVGDSQLYEEPEIREAMEVVLKQFEKSWEGCVLLKLWYDEEASLKEADEWAQQYGGEEAIVLFSHYWVDGSGRSPSLNPNSLYQNWSWILVRNGGKWELKDCGY